jgi:1,4-dihydroxy-2-naphthoate octaprenyltransferase
MTEALLSVMEVPIQLSLGFLLCLVFLGYTEVLNVVYVHTYPMKIKGNK